MSIKNTIRGLITSSSRNPAIYRRFWHPLTRLSALALRENRRARLRPKSKPDDVLAKVSPQFDVLNGPFAGMKYSIGQSAGSSLYPKVVGSYEQELHGFINEVLRGAYTDVIDIGCAEGYYAVGLALKKPDVKVWAFDTDPVGRSLCKKLAEENGVADRVITDSYCDAAAITKIPVRGKTLIICDCEGFEKALFTPANCTALAGYDLLIEIHDFLDPSISRTLYDRLSQTHDIERIPTVTDFARPHVYSQPQLAPYDDGVKILLMAEWRPLEMEWFICRSRSK